LSDTIADLPTCANGALDRWPTRPIMRPWQNHHAGFPAPWHADPIPGGYVVRDANGQALAFVYSRDSDAQVRIAKALKIGRASVYRVLEAS
jgi:hypothetical protein